MIRKLNLSERLKRFEVMDNAEKSRYIEAVKRWCQAGALAAEETADASVYMSSVRASAEWSDDAVSAFMEGAKLLTALKDNGGWLPENLFNKAAGRAIRWMRKTLAEVSTWQVQSGGGLRIPRVQEYLTFFNDMSTNDKTSWLSQVRAWLDGDIKRLINPTAEDVRWQYLSLEAAARAWSETSVRSVNEGLILVTALNKARESWLPGVLQKQAGVAVKELWAMLDEIHAQYNRAYTPRTGERVGHMAYFGDGAVDTSKTAGTERDILEAQAGAHAEAVEKGAAGDEHVRERAIVRPKHIDQYIHLLPEATQKKAAKIKTLLANLDMYRENARRIKDDPHGAPSDAGAWMRKATKVDNELCSIYQEIDQMWNKLVESGAVVVDDLGVARVVKPSGEPESTASGEEGEIPSGKPSDTVSEEQKQDDDAARAAAMRKYLIDTRKKKNQKHNEKWVKIYQEMVELGGQEVVTDKVLAAAKYYGIDLKKL